MDTKNIEREKGKLSFQVTVDAAAFETAVNQAYLKAKRRIMVPGFRKGKAPRMVIEGMYGADVFYEDAVDSLALDAFKAGSAEAGDRTVGDPAITNYHLNDDKSMTISYEIALYPEVTLGEYKGLTAYKAPVEIGDEEVSRELESVQRRNSRILTVDRGAKDGDTVTIDFDGYRDGKRFQGGKGENHDLVLGSGSFVPGFEEQLIGAKAGEERELNITFPEDYTPELAGADVVFKVKVHEVQETQLPELDDEFAKDVSEYDTLEEYKESIRRELAEAREKSVENGFRADLIRKAVSNMTADIPDAMVNSRVNAMLEDVARRCRAQGMSLQQYLGMMGLDEQSYRRFIRPSALSDIQAELLLEKVAEVEGLTASEEEIEAEYASSAERYDTDVETLKKGVPADVIAADLKMRKAGDLIRDNGIATDKKEDTEADSADAEAGTVSAADVEVTEVVPEEPEAAETAEKPKRAAKKAAAAETVPDSEDASEDKPKARRRTRKKEEE